jgi:DNA modification methylase
MNATIRDVLSGAAQWCVVEGDAFEVLRSLGEASVDHVITDPPYDKRTHAKAVTGASRIAGVSVEVTGVSFDALLSAGDTAARIILAAKRWAIAFCSVEDIGAYAAGAGNGWVRAAVWDKINPTPQLTGDRPGQAVEGVAVMHRAGKKRWNRRGGAGIWRFSAERGAKRPNHPTPKPLALMSALVSDFTDPGDLILDPFAGSGTTGVAAVLAGRRVILVERDATYAELCRNRLAEASRAAA